MSVTETHLWAAAEFRTEAMIERMVRQYERPLRAFAQRQIGDWQMAEDMTQETFIKAWLHSGDLREGSSMKAWLFRVLRNNITDVLRKKKHETISLDALLAADDGAVHTLAQYLSDPSPGPQQVVETNWRAKVLSDTRDQLPDAYRDIIDCSFYQGMTYREIADTRKIPIGTVKSRLNYATHRLKKLLTTQKYIADDLIH